MRTNSTGSYIASPKRQMDAFDKLPSSARRALAEARMDFAVQPFLTVMRTHASMTAAKLTEWIRDSDEAEVRKSRKRVWGKDYPA